MIYFFDKITIIVIYSLHTFKLCLERKREMNRKNLKRIAALSIACMTTATLLVGCGDKKSNPYASVEYNVEDYVKLGEYTGLNVDEEITIVTDKDIQDEIDKIVSDKTTYNEITDRYAQTGDRVTVQYIQTVEGSEPEESKTKTFEIGSEDMGEDFEKQMINLALNGTKTFTLEELDETEEETTTEATEAKKVNVTYEVTLTKIEEKVVPEVTDEFIAANSESKTVEEYKTAKKQELEATNASEAKDTAKQNLLDLVVEASTVDNTPAFLYNINYNAIVQNYSTYASYFGMSMNSYLSAFGLTMDDIKKDAVKVTKECLVAESLLKTLGQDITDEEYQEKMKTYMESYNIASLEEAEEALSKDQWLLQMRKEKAIDYLYENSTVNQVMVSGEEDTE